MSKKPIEKPQVTVDESKIDRSNFGEVWAKLYCGPEETPPELNKPLSVEELNAYASNSFAACRSSRTGVPGRS